MKFVVTVHGKIISHAEEEHDLENLDYVDGDNYYVTDSEEVSEYVLTDDATGLNLETFDSFSEALEAVDDYFSEVSIWTV